MFADVESQQNTKTPISEHTDIDFEIPAEKLGKICSGLAENFPRDLDKMSQKIERC